MSNPTVCTAVVRMVNDRRVIEWPDGKSRIVEVSPELFEQFIASMNALDDLRARLDLLEVTCDAANLHIGERPWREMLDAVCPDPERRMDPPSR